MVGIIIMENSFWPLAFWPRGLPGHLNPTYVDRFHTIEATHMKRSIAQTKYPQRGFLGVSSPCLQQQGRTNTTQLIFKFEFESCSPSTDSTSHCFSALFTCWLVPRYIHSMKSIWWQCCLYFWQYIIQVDINTTSQLHNRIMCQLFYHLIFLSLKETEPSSHQLVIWNELYAQNIPVPLTFPNAFE